MRLPDFSKDPDLNSLRSQMGASELGSFRLAFNVYAFTISDLEQVVAAGIAVDGADKVRTLEDRTLSYKGRRVLLHLRDAQAPAEAGLPAFHLSNCGVVRGLRDGARPLVIAAREDGQFQVRVLRGAVEHDSFERLPVCEHCLLELAYEGFDAGWSTAQKLAAVQHFDIARFFQRYGRAISNR